MADIDQKRAEFAYTGCQKRGPRPDRNIPGSAQQIMEEQCLVPNRPVRIATLYTNVI